MAGYLNLLANSIDNFTHGLSVGGAFLVSTRLGITTTLAILCHEIPHEFSDFGIILNAGFSRYKAAALQLITAGGGLLGALFALMCSGSANSIGKLLPEVSNIFIAKGHIEWQLPKVQHCSIYCTDILKDSYFY